MFWNTFNAVSIIKIYLWSCKMTVLEGKKSPNVLTFSKLVQTKLIGFYFNAFFHCIHWDSEAQWADQISQLLSKSYFPGMWHHYASCYWYLILLVKTIDRQLTIQKWDYMLYAIQINSISQTIWKLLTKMVLILFNCFFVLPD